MSPRREQKLVIPAVAEKDVSKTHSAAVLLDNTKAVLDVKNFIPH